MAGFLDYLKDASSWLKSEENQGTVGLLSMLGTAAFSGSGSDFFDTQIDKVGYQGEIPDYTAVRERVQDTYDPNRRPGSGGQRFFSETEFAEQGQEASAKQRAVQQALNLKAQNAANMARQSSQYGAPPQPQPQMPMPVMGAAPSQVGTMMPPPQQGGLASFSPQYKYGGGIAALAGGGAASPYNRRYNGYAVGGQPS